MKKQISTVLIGAINTLAVNAHNNSRNKGFWEDYDNAMSYAKDVTSKEGREELEGIIKSMWSGKSLMEASGELGEAIEAIRTNKEAEWDSYLNILRYKGEDFNSAAFEAFIKDSKGDEIADCIVRLLQQCVGENIDIGRHIVHKMAYNLNRPHKHGKKF